MIIGITGTDGAGKDTVAQLLADKLGWPHFSLSDELRDIAKEQGLDTARDTLAQLGEELRTAHGPDYVARRIVMRAPANFVATSIRRPEECIPFQERGRFLLIFVDAPPELRYQRTFSRNRAGEAGLTMADFLRHEAEVEMTETAAGQQLHKVQQLADVTIINGGTVVQLGEKLDRIIAEVKHGQAQLG